MTKLTEDMIIARTKSSELGAVKKLNCWGSDLVDVSLVKRLNNVEVLSLSLNKITTLSDFQYCRNLVELYIRRNSIRDLSEVCYLQDLPRLRRLLLAENPCVESIPEQLYRSTVIRCLPHLEVLDNNEVTPEEVEQSMRVGLILEHPLERGSPDPTYYREGSPPPPPQPQPKEYEEVFTKKSLISRSPPPDYSPYAQQPNEEPTKGPLLPEGGNAQVLQVTPTPSQTVPQFSGGSDPSFVPSSTTTTINNGTPRRLSVQSSSADEGGRGPSPPSSGGRTRTPPTTTTTNMNNANQPTTDSSSGVRRPPQPQRHSSPVLEYSNYPTRDRDSVERETINNGGGYSSGGQGYQGGQEVVYYNDEPSPPPPQVQYRNNTNNNANTQRHSLPSSRSKTRSKSSNLLSAVLCLIPELDWQSLEVVELAVKRRMDELISD